MREPMEMDVVLVLVKLRLGGQKRRTNAFVQISTVKSSTAMCIVEEALTEL